MTYIRKLLLLALLLLAPSVWAGFDPVHEDIDIFLVNPSINSERPNVLIMLDNTANWNQAFTDEKSALVSLINSLTDQFNVGIGMYVETGGGNDNNDGAYLRFGVRQMKNTDTAPTSSGTSAAPNNRYALSSLVQSLDKLGDKGNNNTISLAMAEVYAYFKGTTSWSSYGKVKTDYNGNTSNNPLAASIGNNAFSATSPTSSSLFNSPTIDGCQKNFVIYIANGKFNENSSATSTSLSRLTTARGSAPPTIAISPNGQQGNWADEWAYYLANMGFSKTIGGVNKTAFVNFYTVAVDPSSNSWDAGSIALMQSIAKQGKGKYFAVTSGDGGTAIVDALNAIFTEIQAVNSVFASTTLPVSVNVRGTNLNQVYIGMFRPDAAKAPRWYGNLKEYKLALDSQKNLYLSDAVNKVAEDPTTGFISNGGTSYWTHSSSYWSWRDSSLNGTGGGSDSPDGNLVEKGAVAQMLREANLSSQASRNLYTCTSGCNACAVGGSGTAQTCTNGSLLSSTPFSNSNASITATALNLGTKSVSPLTGKRSVALSAVTDRRSVTLNNTTAGTVYTLSSLNDGASTKSVSTLSTGVTLSISALTGLATSTRTITGYSTTGNGNSSVTTVTTSTAHGLSVGTSITVSGSGSNKLDGTTTVVSVPTTTTFTVAVGGAGSGSAGTVTYLGASTTATATVANHGLTTGSTVTISAASPSVFNGSYGVTVIDANTFTYLLSSAQGAATSNGSMTKTTTTATVTTTSAHGFSVGNSVVIAGANPTGYNGTFTILTVPSSTTFTITTPALSDNLASGVTVTKGATTTATGVTSVANGFVAGVTQVTVTGADSCYNGTYTVANTPSATQFTYTLASSCAQNTASTGMTVTSGAAFGTTITATLSNHGFAVGNNITIADGSVAAHNGNFTVSAVTASTFSYTGGPAVAPGNNYTVRLTSNPLAYATVNSHGFTTGNSVTVTGTTTAADTPATSSNAYNGTFTVTVIDSNTVSYSLSAAKGTQTAASGMAASVNTTTATATSVNHGFANGTTVDITGASPSAFNGSFVISNVSTNSFTYTLSSAQGDATGTIQASAGSGTNSEKSLLVDWVRGQDNAEDENSDGSTTDCRASIHGDVLHSRPAVINYNRYGGDNDVYVFYGANDGVFHAVKGGGATNDSGDPTTLSPGAEAWGFVPTEAFGSLSRLRNNSPVVSSSFKKPYFMDGPIGVYTYDGNQDGKESSSTSSDKVFLYVGARRGGRYIYSLDVTNPTAPAYRWKIDNSTSGFGEMGYSWSQPTVVSGIAGYTNPVLVFGGGYDPSVEDVENCTISSVSAASFNTGTSVYTAGSVTYNNGTVTYNIGSTGCSISGGSTSTVTRSMGRAIYIVDAITGAKVWSASYRGSGADLEVDGMDFAIPSDITVVKNLSGGLTNRGYVGDTGGNLWRIDFADTDKSKWTVTKIASIANSSTAAGRRKFQSPPDVVGYAGYDALLIGSGDREHPFDNTVVNRFYMFRDHGSDSGPGTGTTTAMVAGTRTVTTRAAVADGSGNPVITHASGVTNASITATNNDGLLYDATNNCVQNASGSGCGTTTTATEISELSLADGWFITLGTGEKSIGNAVALNGVVFFNTNQPNQTEDSSCVGNLGLARQYQVSVTDASVPNLSKDAASTVDTSARFVFHAGGGYLPSPVHVVVRVTDPSTGQLVTKEGVISGTSVQSPTQGALGTRVRRFWYKEVDDN